MAACSLGPRYKHPDIPTPAAWRLDPTSSRAEGAARGAQDTASPSSPGTPNPPSWPSADWWRGFGSTQLDDLILQAQHANDDLAAAIARVQQADAQVKITGAALLPAISVGGDASRQRQTPSAASPAGAHAITFSQFTATAAASYELDFWGKNRALRESARMAAAASRYDRTTVELTVMTSVATTYFQALALNDRLSVALKNRDIAETVLKDFTLEASVGTATALDVAQQETTVAVVNASIPPLRQQLRQMVDALAVLIGKAPQELSTPAGTLAELSEPQVSPGLPSELLIRRPDVAQAEAELMAANADIAAARAAFFPSIDLTANGGYESTALAALFTPANRIFALTGSVTQQIFAGGALVGRYSQTKARYTELLADYHKSVISAFSNVEDALAAAQQTAEQYRREEEAVAKARRAYELTETQFHAGVVNILTVLSTQTALFTAEDTLVQVRLAHLQALVQLFGALGGGWQQQSHS